MSQKTPKFDEIAKRVLANYELLEPQTAFIRYSDNVTYKVTTADGKAWPVSIIWIQ
jgi:hypothetical protein